MQAGDLVKFDPHLYPTLDRKLGVLLGRTGNKDQWEVLIDGQIHPYFIGLVEGIEVFSASR